MVNYTSMNNIAQNYQISDSLRSHVLAPLNTTSTSTSPYGLVHINLNFLGFSLFSFVQPASAWGFSLPNINVNSLVNTATSVAKNVASTASDTLKSAVSLATSPSVKNFAKDLTGGAVNALLHNPVTDTINGAGKAVNSFVSSVGNGLGSIGKGIVDTVKNPANLLNTLNPLGAVFSTGLNLIKPFIPYILLGLGVIVLAVLAYFLLYRKIVMGFLK